jgi:hypothetical protein
MNAARTAPNPSPDAELGLNALAPSPDAKNAVALRRLIAPVLVAVVAVGALLFFVKGLPPLPAYRGAASVDGAAAGPTATEARLDSALVLTLTPQGELGGPVDGTVYVAEGGAVRRLIPRPEVSEAGVVTFRGTVRSLGVQPGAVQVILLATRPGGQPETPAAVLQEGAWQALRVPLQVNP